MTYSTQDLWTWWLAIYLYTGGLGAATLAVTFLTDMYLKPHPQPGALGRGRRRRPAVASARSCCSGICSITSR